MAKGFRTPTAERMARMERRLRYEASRNAAGKAPGDRAVTLRGLIDELGFYDNVGGVDAVIQQAEAAANANTAKQPDLGQKIVLQGDPIPQPDGTEVLPDPVELKYRNFFPEIDYGATDQKVPVFFSGDPDVAKSSYALMGRYGPASANKSIMAGQAAAAHTGMPTGIMKHARSLLQGLALDDMPGSPQSQWNRTRYPSEANWGEIANRLSQSPEWQDLRLAAGEEVADRALLAGLLAETFTSGQIPPHIVLRHSSGRSPYAYSPRGRRDFTPVLMHEATHFGLQPHEVRFQAEGAVDPNNMEHFANDNWGYHTAADIAYSNVFSPEQIAAMGPEEAMKQAQMLKYRTMPVEADTVLADIKRAYAEQTGRLVNTPEEAERALLWFAKLGPSEADQIFTTLPYGTAARPVDAQYFLFPDLFTSPNGLPLDPNVYKRRMTEVLGLGGAAVLGGLLGEEREDGSRTY